MFFEPLISGRVYPILEVGPGAVPYPLSDIWLDLELEENERLAQAGWEEPSAGKPKVYYSGGRFPFKDKSFKYVIASHVLEHVRWELVPQFISELERVAEAGYIELPRWPYELLHDIPEHVLVGDIRGNKLHLFRKKYHHHYDFFSAPLQERSSSFRRFIGAEKRLFFCRIDWVHHISYQIHENGYPINENSLDISRAFKSELDDLILGYPERHNKYNYLRVILNKVCAILGYQSPSHLSALFRKDIDDAELISVLSCPNCGGQINENFYCSDCDFSFKKMDKELYPRCNRKSQ